MKANIKITALVGIAFLSSFAILTVFLDMYSAGLLPSTTTILEDQEDIFDQNPKHATLDVLRNFSGVSKADTININSLGFRGDEFSEIKPDRTYRIFMLGSSPMFGYGATSDETTIPGFMQKFLGKTDFGFDIEVINSGVQAIRSDTELELVKQKLITFSPDLIIIYDGWNDLRSSISPNVIKENWEFACEIGNENNFDTVISLQPIAGFGSKKLTQQESEYAKNAIKFFQESMIEPLSVYPKYAKNLSEIKICTKTIDLRDVFDNETETIYSDHAHHSDQGNAIVAKSLYNAILPIILKNKEFNIFENEKDFDSLTTSMYDGREIVVNVELLPSTELDNKRIKISTYDNTYNEYVHNVTYFLAISKNNENLLSEYFFAQDGVLILNVQPNNDPLIKVIGEKQYDNNAYVMPGSKYTVEMFGENLTSVTPLQIVGSIFNTDGIYTFDTELITIDSRDNWVYSLSGFHYEITMGN
jgi:lysophospholipase L1-like esterase